MHPTNGFALAGRFGMPEPGALLPPQNIDAEMGTLGGMIADNDMIPEVLEILRPEDFFRASHAALFRAIADVHGRGQAVDPLILAEEMERRGDFEDFGGYDALTEIMERLPVAANTAYYAAIVKSKAMTRDLAGAAEETLREVYSNEHTAEDLTARAIARLSASARDGEDREFRGLRPWPDDPDPAVWQGVAGELVGLIAPHTEADPVAILAQFLVCFGNMIGRNPHWRIEATRHGCNLYLCVVGNSAMARKGTSWDHVRRVVGSCDKEWASERIMGGLSSGEGLIWTVRDPITRREKMGGVPGLGGGGYHEVEMDPGVPDKRALFVESEFGSTLAVLAREGNILSGLLRQGWDGQTLRTATKNNPARSTGAHISVIGHTTCEELHRRLTQTDAANGFANRFLWLCARRSQCLPRGGQIHRVDFAAVYRRLQEAVTFARDEFEEDECPVMLDAEAADLWDEFYPSLTVSRPGLLGAVTTRAAPQTMRLAVIYALLDRSKWVRPHHLRAGRALWTYCDQSAAYIFGDALGDPDAEKLLEAIAAAGEAGLTQTQIRREVFRGHRSGDDIARSVGVLLRAGLIAMETRATRGRPGTFWKVQGAPKAPLAPKGISDDATSDVAEF